MSLLLDLRNEQDGNGRHVILVSLRQRKHRVMLATKEGVGRWRL
ncbi:hypothetical protein [Bradyrhizobium sp. Arg816]|nr:hypothetical protein [Bradyrhizobium sp. Arg816]MDI3562443.1 hypothetical protein [Bradyrhizobium sp. Arg816]